MSFLSLGPPWCETSKWMILFTHRHADRKSHSTLIQLVVTDLQVKFLFVKGFKFESAGDNLYIFYPKF